MDSMRAIPPIVLLMLLLALPGCGDRGDRGESAERVPLAGKVAGEEVAAGGESDARIRGDASRLSSRTGEGGPDEASADQRHRRGDPDCARIETRTRSVASVSGGPMQMIMVTECVPAKK
ncbi:hypothetical protein [Luteimonas kalidii]|uniref:Secreted protein n=1 Tax=Luteimonas kalidii TaxID=3042025 RepID=A0ABT6JUV6_9GAMM|nr:hypothetical protein [Luteimonas kalidii]MDH5834474.1 hypothetical protein [Luteimonas kalidii]